MMIVMTIIFACFTVFFTVSMFCYAVTFWKLITEKVVPYSWLLAGNLATVGVIITSMLWFFLRLSGVPAPY